MMRKMGNLSINSRENMKVISALSLGMREKLILVQVGEKQLLLGVTAGRIDNLLVLEGEQQLFQQQSDKQSDGEFSKKLKQLIAGSASE
jgi:flagellar protein FliO/FliZ